MGAKPGGETAATTAATAAAAAAAAAAIVRTVRAAGVTLTRVAIMVV
jgi:hypothetical protein